jgi:hypothetical protein
MAQTILVIGDGGHKMAAAIAILATCIGKQNDIAFVKEENAKLLPISPNPPIPIEPVKLKNAEYITDRNVTPKHYKSKHERRR